MKTVIEMAREAIQEAPREDWNSTAWVFGEETLERFAELVRADERNRPWTQEHWTEYEHSIAAAEREACAALADKLEWSDNKGVASAIRARTGEQK